jgi:tripartite-type tricarboxylate transporter receptor subunit TctC
MTKPMRILHSVTVRGVAASWLLTALTSISFGQGDGEFYKGKQISLIINSAAGGGYDVYARAFARHFSRHVPGNPVIVAKNLPGAGGIIAANALYANSDHDGLTLGALANTAVFDSLLGSPGVKYDARKLNWLGSIAKVSSVCATYHTSPIKTVADTRVRDVIVGGAGVGTNSVLMPHVLNTILGTRFKVIRGYEGTGFFLAMERGETDGICGLSWSTLKASRPDLVSEKKLNVILQMSLEKLSELPDVPSVLDLISDATNKKVLEFFLLRQETGRPFATAPGVPASRVDALRKAFDATMADTEFLADAARTNLEIEPLRGAQVEQMLTSAYASPRDLVEKTAILIEQASKAR